MKIKRFIIALLIICISSTFFISCIDDSISNSPNDKLTFTENSYTFDTVFTTIGSTTAKLKVYNKNESDLNISSIYLAGGATSPFKLNVSGQSSATQSFSDILISANDSMYFFVQVTVDPNNQNSPILIEDSIIFKVNGNTQIYTLQAYGQDVILLKNISLLNDTSLLNTKPYLIYGDLSIAENKTLTIGKGCQFYFHQDAGLTIHGNLIANGTLSEPIVFRGDRLDDLLEDMPYDAVSGQWEGLKFTSENATHQLDYVEIRNAKIGINIWCGDIGKPQLTIKNSRIHNFDSCGVIAKNTYLEIINTEISNSSNYCLSIQGGEFNIIHSTIANFYDKSDRHSASVIIKNYFDNESVISLFPITQGKIINSIIHGNRNEELFLDYKNDGIAVATDFSITIDNCLINGESSTDSYFSNIIWSSSSESVFEKTDEYPFNFKLIETSSAKDCANMTTANLYPIDKEENSRIADGKADIGAYEWVLP